MCTVYSDSADFQWCFWKSSKCLVAEELLPCKLGSHFEILPNTISKLGLKNAKKELRIFTPPHTYAKLIEIKLLYLQKRHGLHESVGKMESNDIPHGSQFGSFLL